MFWLTHCLTQYLRNALTQFPPNLPYTCTSTQWHIKAFIYISMVTVTSHPLFSCSCMPYLKIFSPNSPQKSPSTLQWPDYMIFVLTGQSLSDSRNVCVCGAAWRNRMYKSAHPCMLTTYLLYYCFTECSLVTCAFFGQTRMWTAHWRRHISACGLSSCTCFGLGD